MRYRPTPPDRVRVIARLDIKGPNLIKGVHLEGLRVIGDPQVYASRYYESGVDELIYLDAVASLYERNSLHDLVAHAAANLFVPLTVAGGVRSVEDAAALLRVGADKVGVNTAAVRRPELVEELAERFGSQCVVAQIDAKSTPTGGWEVYTDGGREHTGLDVLQWACEVVRRGAGEILLTSIDREGTRRGYDTRLFSSVATSVSVPVIASGGFGEVRHAVEAVRDGSADAVAVADAFHRARSTPQEIRAAFRTELVRV
jgi:imidazole glycerol-phosphate synthase subunit HisF